MVLIKKKKTRHFSITESVAPGLDQQGAILPYSPLLGIIASDFQKPIVATSGNISNSPIIFQDQNAWKELGSLADFILTNNREIVTPQDDSVVRFSPLYQKKIILRRSRGISPDLNLPQQTKDIQTKITFGASAKSIFCIQNGHQIYMSQYHGDL